MSENHVEEQLSKSHGVTEQGIEGNPIENEYPAEASDSSGATNLVEQSNGVSQLPFESATHTDRDNVSEGTFTGNALEAMNQGDPDDGKSTEDTAKDDMFVDCPDELITFDGRQTESKEETEAGENKENSEENQQSHFGELGNGVGDGSLTAELEQLRHMLGKTVAEKESITREYKEERESVAQVVLGLHCQLKALSGQQSSEVGVRDKEAQLADIPLKEMINECLESVKTTSEERSNTEATIRNLHALLSAKDLEIENLSGKVTELSVSLDNSAQKILELSSEIQIEKDHNVDVVIDRIMSSLATVVNQEQVLDNSISGKIVHVEQGTALFIEKYNNILSEIYQLGQSFSEAGLDAREQEYGNILVAARGGLLELKRKEAELFDKLAQLEDENRKLVEELDKERVMMGTLNAEIGNMKKELEHEKVKCANTKEKLSMAVTKGKALVQQRDSLKQSLAEKSNELEKCLIEVQEKSVELETARLTKDELVRSENMVASLQSSLLQSNMIIEQVEKILLQTEPDKTELLDMPGRLRWIVDDRNVLKGAFQELCKLKDALSLVNLPESVSSSDLESQMNWLRDSFHSARYDMNILQEEISKIKEAAHNSIDCLSASLLLELQEKDYLQSELADLRCKYEQIIEKSHQISMEKDQIVKMLVELSGCNLEDEGIDHSSSDTSMIINLCLQMIKEQSGPYSRSSHIDAELFERIQSHLYVRDQELFLCEDILEEEMLIRSEVNKLSNELKMASDEILALKEEKGSLQNDLDRSEEKSVVLRDKLSMAVKKGKGLVQDRDNLKSLINEKNSEIEQLKLGLQKQESVVSEYMDRINRLSSEVESIPKLEADLLAVRSERNQFEQFLLESNNMLQRVIESIDGIILPVDSVFEEPVEKVKWLAGYVGECQDAKLHAEQELQLVKEGASNLESKLAEGQATIKSLEQALSSSENGISQVAEEKRELEFGKAKVEEELHKTKEEVAEVCASAKLLRDALSQAEKDISLLSNEKELAQTGRVAAETELERVKEEAASLTSKLGEASRTIKDLEDTLSQAESNVNLLESNNMLQRVIESIDGIILPIDSVFDEPVEKVKWLAGYVSECQDAKLHAEQELQLVKEGAGNLGSKLAEGQATIKSLEQALSSSENSISQVAEEKRELEFGKAKVEEELHKVKEEVAEVCASAKLLRDALSQTEKDISVLSNEKQLAQTGRVAAETELERVKEEAASLTRKLGEASRTIKDFEGTLSQAESNINLLKEKCDADQVVKTNMQNELKKLHDEAEQQASKLVDAFATIKSLGDALSKAQDEISVLEDANKIAKEEISSLSIKLNSCLDELAGKNGSLENRSIELIGLLNDLKVLMKEDTVLPRVKQCFEKKFETLKNMDLILNKIRDYIVGMTAKDPGRHHMMEEDLFKRKTSFDGLENFDVEVDSTAINDTDMDDIISLLGKIVKGFQLRNNLIADRFDDFSDSIDGFISLLRTKLLETETSVVRIFEHMETLKEKVNTGESLKEEQDNTIATLENDISVLLSACTAASCELQPEVHKNLVEPGPDAEIMNLDADALAKPHQDSKYMETAQKLINATRKAQTLIKHFEFRSNEVDATIEDLLNKLKETRAASDKVIEERDQSQNRVLQLEADIRVLQSSCSELRNNLEGYHALEEKLEEKEAEISSLYGALSTKEQEAETPLLSASQVRTLFGKIDKIEIPVEESEDNMEPNTSAPVKKLFYIIDSVTRLHHQINSLSQDKEELQTTLPTKVFEIKHLKEEVEQHNSNWEDLEKMKNELSEFTFALEKVLGMLGASDWVEDKKPTSLKELLPVLEKQVMTLLLESENSKSKAQELGIKLLGSQKVIDELTTKVKLLEDSLHDGTSQSEIVQERSLFEAPSLPAGSEISEVEEGSSLGKKVISPVSSAAHVRNMRKGSTDHLALDIDVESDRLISSADTDEDKGHVFKSLNTTGFVPKQGKLIADRIDGIWVSGGRVLMSRPRARLGLLGYFLLLHIWLLGTIL